jgi:hydrogenase/urease accessory protein HupE
VEYLGQGIRHILGGYDHLLFIGALVLTTATLLDLVKIVSAFTVAHSITLTLAAADVVRLPSHVVEPMIAASIVVVALFNVVRPDRSRDRTRLAMAFFFGLFHGLGFAGGLRDAMEGLPGPAISLAIVAFSAGVEIGHQTIVLPIFAGLAMIRRTSGGGAARWNALSVAVVRAGSTLISVAGMIYLVAALRSHATITRMG